jgi:phosphatidylserine/phosphatidylglycerophosphate/cardiolipin synthase-like enzyme
MKIVVFILALTLAQCYNQPFLKSVEISDSQSNPLKYSVHFSPKGGCENAIVNLIRSAKKSIKVQAYGFTNSNIIKALEFVNSDVEVQVVLDKSNVKNSEGWVKGKSLSLFFDGKVYIDHKHSIAHNKVIIVDSEIVETGSYNFTEAAELHNAENCLIIYDKGLAKEYEDNFKLHLNHSELLKPSD